MSENQAQKRQKLTYANVDNVVINAIIGGLYSFKTIDDAREVLASLREKFIFSKLTPNDSLDSAIIWIKGYEVETQEKGYAGNFANIYVEAKSAKKFTILAQKIPTDLKHHPQRIYEKAQHPNWGFPILRAIKKGKKYIAAEQALKDLRYLQEEFPKTAVPAAGKLYIMIYEKAATGKGGAVNKYVLEIKASEQNDGFYIDYYLNQSAAKKPKTNDEDGKEPQGKFTAMVELRRAKKKHVIPTLPKKPSE